MPRISLTLADVSQSISRPIIYDIIGQISNITKINDKSKIFFPGPIEKMKTVGSDIDSSSERFAQFDTNYITFIEVEEDFDKEAIGSTAVMQREHIPVFIDEKLDVQIVPVYAKNDVTLNIRYRCPSETEAKRWYNDLRMKFSQYRDVNLHKIKYHYMLPRETLLLIKDIYLLRENVSGYGESLDEYLIGHSSDRLDIIGNLVGEEARFVITETQTRIEGLYDFDGMPEKPSRQDKGYWEITFSYRFSYEMPIACNMRYPIMVHNQLLPKEYTIFNNTQYDINKDNLSASASLNALYSFEMNTIIDQRIRPDAMIRLPYFDDYIMPMVPKGTGTVFLALCEVDKTDNRTLMNLKDLGPIILDKDILDFIISSEIPYICKMFKSIIHISLYRNNSLTTFNTIDCDYSLNIHGIEDLDLRNLHHIRMSLVCDLSLLTSDAIDRLKKYPKALVKIISAMNDLLKNNPDFIHLSDERYITDLQFSAIYQMLTGYAYSNGRSSSDRFGYNLTPNVSAWPYNGYSGLLFKDIDPRMVENYRNNRIGMNTVQAMGVIAYPKN